MYQFPEQPYADFGIDMLYFITFFSVFLFVFLLMAIVMKKGYDYYRLRRLQEEYIRAYQNRFIAPTGAVNIVDKNDLLMPWRPNASLKPLSLEFARKEDMQVTAATYICLLPWDRDVVRFIIIFFFFPLLSEQIKYEQYAGNKPA